MPTPVEPIDPGVLRRLERLRLACRHAARPAPGRRRAPPAGASLEIDSYRPYGPGDDLRFLDWPSWMRLDQLLVRQFRAERSTAVDLVLDTSRSMAVPARDGKLGFAVNVAALLGWVALAAGDGLRVVGFTRTSPLFRHRASYARVRQFLASLDAGGSTTLRETVAADSTWARRKPGLIVVLSDFLLPPADARAALEGLRAAGHDVVAIHVSGAGERRAPRPGRYRLRDAETGAERLVWLDRGDEAGAARHADAVRAIAEACRVRLVPADAGEGAAPFVLRALPALRVVR